MKQILIFFSIVVIAGISGHILFRIIELSFPLALLSSVSIFLVLMLINITLKRLALNDLSKIPSTDDISETPDKAETVDVQIEKKHSDTDSLAHSSESFSAIDTPETHTQLREPQSHEDKTPAVSHDNHNNELKTSFLTEHTDIKKDSVIKEQKQSLDKPVLSAQSHNHNNENLAKEYNVSQLYSQHTTLMSDLDKLDKSSDNHLTGELESLKNRVAFLEKKLQDETKISSELDLLSDSFQTYYDDKDTPSVHTPDQKPDSHEFNAQAMKKAILNPRSDASDDVVVPQTPSKHQSKATEQTHNLNDQYNEEPKRLVDELSDLIPGIENETFAETPLKATSFEQNSDQAGTRQNDNNTHFTTDGNVIRQKETTPTVDNDSDTNNHVMKKESFNEDSIINKINITDKFQISEENDSSITFQDSLTNTDDTSFNSTIETKYGSLIEDVRKAIFSSNIEALLQPIIELPSKRINSYESFLRIKDSQGNPIKEEDVRAIAHPLGLLPKRDLKGIEIVLNVAEKLIKKERKTPIIFPLNIEVVKDSEYFDELKEIIEKHHNITHMLIFEFYQNDYDDMDKLTWHSLKVLARSGIRFSLNNITNLDIDFRHLSSDNFSIIRLEQKDFLHNVTTLNGQFLQEDYYHALQRFGIKMVISHIEDTETFDKLIEKNIHHMQGNFFARPRIVRDDIHSK